MKKQLFFLSATPGRYAETIAEAGATVLDRVFVESVVDMLAIAPIGQNSRLAEHPQVPTDRRLRKSNLFSYLIDHHRPGGK